MTEVPYGQYSEAYKAIHSALSGLTAPPSGKKVTKLTFSWNADGSIHMLSFFGGAELLFSLTFAWNLDGSLAEIVRA